MDFAILEGLRTVTSKIALGDVEALEIVIKTG